MSKLAHSNQETMDELDRQRAIENGDEDLIPAQTAKHTPGPLEAVLNTDGRHHAVPIMARAPEFLAETQPYHPLIANVFHGRRHASKEVAEATAILFAASPKLLDALKSAIPILATAAKDDSLKASAPGILVERNKTLETARAAIAEAEGR